MSLSSWKLWCYKLAMRFMPETSFFPLKRIMLRWCGARVGKNVRICSSAIFLGAGELIIGADTWIGHCSLIIASSTITIGERVDIAPRVYIGTGTHVSNFDGDRCAGMGINQDIVIGDGCWIGACATILPGVSIGKMSIIGAGALVNKPLPERVTAVGVPAKILCQHPQK
jgi:acetyltransferase-like isoleucine patch superfamily enzyme